MNCLKIIFGITFCIITKLNAQTYQDFETLNKISFPSDSIQRFDEFRKQQGTIQIVLSKVFIFYKHYISSQDANSCPFDTTCSVYFISSIKKHGLIKGYLQGIDRYTRCNGYSTAKYMRSKNGKLLDKPAY